MIQMTKNENENNLTGFEIAVIGMAGRFPGAGTVAQFWENVKNGVESTAYFTDRELEDAGVPAEVLTDPRYIKAWGWMDDVETFDASFFGYTPLEAETMDPQVRVFHECVLTALENAGYDPYSYNKTIGLYAGASANFNWQARVELSGNRAVLGKFASKQLSDKDFLCTHIAHRLNLKGPAVILDTACSTSLVAVHMACQGLIGGDCDMALAGGVSVPALHKSGYYYEEGLMLSPDGHCRAFDAAAKGTGFGNASAVVVLKRLEDALADGDTIHAVIKGSAVNNDGSAKAAYTAPSFKGQARVIRTALKMAAIHPETVGYVETHGTGTALGDPVEIEGLKTAFNTTKKHFCRLGSVKTNVGHLEMAAGVTGFIKTVMALKHRLIPPTLFFENPNPKIDFENSPFIVNTRLTEWKRGDHPRRAGVSSFGIGGTNAHVVLEEWPEDHSAEAGRKHHLFLLSAKTETALETMTTNLADRLKEEIRPIGPISSSFLGDAAYTLQVGRAVHPHRRMLVCSTVEEAAALLSTPAHAGVKTYRAREANRPVVFMFPGLGSQYVNMGRGLYEEEPVFRQEMDRCFSLLKDDLKEIVFNGSNPEALHRIDIAQSLVFIIEYALAKLLIAWGIKPFALIGYSFGEYTAACISGVLTLEDALKLVEARGRLIRELPAGAMLSVPLSRQDIVPLLDEELSLAIDNGPSCVVAGPGNAVSAFENRMKEKKVLCMRVSASHALHSRMMAPVREKFEEILRTVPLNKPKIPYISNVTGNWTKDEDAVDPRYWAAHLSETVQFADGMKTLLKEFNPVLVEVGPGRDLSALAVRHLEDHGEDGVINLLRLPHQKQTDTAFLLDRIGMLWLYGQPIDWERFYSGEKRRRIPMPAYPFESRSFSIDVDFENKKIGFSREPGLADRFYLPTWERSVSPGVRTRRCPGPAEQNRCLVFPGKNETIGPLLVSALKQDGSDVIEVTPGPRFHTQNHRSFTIDPGSSDDYHALFRELQSLRLLPQWIVSLWGITGKDTGETESNPFEELPGPEFYHILYLAKALDKVNPEEAPRIFVITDRMQEVLGNEPLNPAKASVIGPVNVLPQEFPGTLCRSIDIVPPDSGSPEEERLVGQLLEEFSAGSVESVVAYRGNFRWVQVFKPFPLDEAIEKDVTPVLREKGVYLITGGTGSIGLILARYLAQEVQAKLVLTGRSQFPPRQDWDQWQVEHGENETVSQKIKEIKEIEETGGEVLVFSADAADRKGMREVIARAEQRFGPVNGVFFAAGIVSGKTFRGIRDIKEEECRLQFRAKADGVMVLEELFQDKVLDFCCLISSISTVLGGPGFVAYAAANSYMDAHARKHNRFGPNRWISVNWDGMGERDTRIAFHRILSLKGIDQVAVSNSGNLPDRIAKWINPDITASHSRPSQPRPSLSNSYTPPRNRVEQTLADIWAGLFGIDRVGIHDDFFDLGGDSLKALIVIPRIHKELNAEIPLAEFFKRPTIEGLSELIPGLVGDGKRGYQPIPPVEKKEFYPVSCLQKQMYVLNKMGGTGTAYNNFFGFTVEGDVDWEHFLRALRNIICRHDSFRTSFHLVGGNPVQVVCDSVDFDIEYPASADNTPPDPAALIRRFVRPFDLKKAPLLRTAVVPLPSGESFLIFFDMHHIISDGTSIIIFMRELVHLYEDRELPRLRVRYTDFSQWQSTGEGKREIEKQEDFWLRCIENDLPVLDMPTDFPRPRIQEFQGEKIRFRLEETLEEGLNRLVKETGTTLYMVLLALCTVLLHKYTGQEDIVIGTPTAGRERPELEDVIGLFINALLMRNFPHPHLTFSGFLEQVKENTLSVFENQGYPFGKLVERMDLKKYINRNPMYDFELIVQNMESPDLQIRGLRLHPYGVESGTAQVDIALEVPVTEKDILFNLTYCTALFKRKTMEQFVRHFKEAAAVVTRDPGIRLQDIRLSHDLTTAGTAILEKDEGIDFEF